MIFSEKAIILESSVIDCWLNAYFKGVLHWPLAWQNTLKCTMLIFRDSTDSEIDVL